MFTGVYCVFSSHFNLAISHFGVLFLCLLVFTASFPLILTWFCYCKKQIDLSFLWVLPLIGDKLRHNILKVYCGNHEPHTSAMLMTQFIINKRIEALKTEANLFFCFLACQRLRILSLQCQRSKTSRCWRALPYRNQPH